jgi:trans-2,3-dihydro-3-hydroxyanthranilate isomerase
VAVRRAAPATGSACANLGGWLAMRRAVPCKLMVSQGERPSTVYLDLDPQRRIHGCGEVIGLGRGRINI